MLYTWNGSRHPSFGKIPLVVDVVEADLDLGVVVVEADYYISI